MQKISYKILSFASGCCNCYDCIPMIVCPQGAIEDKFINGRVVPRIDYNKCDNCGRCLDVCPFGAVRKFVGRRMQVTKGERG